jgi:hypothetical protein
VNEYDYEYEWDDTYCYPNSFVLKNKLNLRDGEKLAEAERRLTSLNILEITDKPVRGKFDLKHLLGSLTRDSSFRRSGKKCSVVFISSKKKFASSCMRLFSALVIPLLNSVLPSKIPVCGFDLYIYYTINRIFWPPFFPIYSEEVTVQG